MAHTKIPTGLKQEYNHPLDGRTYYDTIEEALRDNKYEVVPRPSPPYPTPEEIKTNRFIGQKMVIVNPPNSDSPREYWFKDGIENKDLVEYTSDGKYLWEKVNASGGGSGGGGDFELRNEFNSHINNSEIHITKTERDKWNKPPIGIPTTNLEEASSFSVADSRVVSVRHPSGKFYADLTNMLNNTIFWLVLNPQTANELKVTFTGAYGSPSYAFKPFSIILCCFKHNRGVKVIELGSNSFKMESYTNKPSMTIENDLVVYLTPIAQTGSQDVTIDLAYYNIGDIITFSVAPSSGVRVLNFIAKNNANGYEYTIPANSVAYFSFRVFDTGSIKNILPLNKL
ncbi:MAG: hypothetical protein LBC87_12070 [Fibromonadaceae bacterium]|jgi:hypothetical protein|nr:hypothetical protein [Fibromonadaceae bacterium]